jgi:hypothetical protein
MGAYGCQLVVGQEEIPFASPIKIFPNPFSGSLNIESAKLIEQLKLYHLDGRLLFQKQSVSPHFSIDFPNTIPAGFYILVLQTNEGLAFYKLQKQ